jgi:hypothetical protein
MYRLNLNLITYVQYWKLKMSEIKITEVKLKSSFDDSIINNPIRSKLIMAQAIKLGASEKYPLTELFQREITKIIALGKDGFQVSELYTVGSSLYSLYGKTDGLVTEAKASITTAEYQAALAFKTTSLLAETFKIDFNKDGVNEFGLDATNTILDCTFYILEEFKTAFADGLQFEDAQVIAKVIPYITAIAGAYGTVSPELNDLTTDELAQLSQTLTFKTSEFIKSLL